MSARPLDSESVQQLPVGVRVRWHARYGTLFGRVTGLDGENRLEVQEETSGKSWSLHPETSHIFLVGRP